MSALSYKKIQALENQSSLARKVFEYVPIQSAWSCTDIHRTMHREDATGASFKVVDGCLKDLRDLKIIREPKPGLYQRDALPVGKQPELELDAVDGVTRNGMIVREEKKKPAPKEPAVIQGNAPVTTKPESAVDMLTELSVELSDFVTMVSQTALKLGTRISDIAARVEAEQAENAVELEKLRSLKSLLKSLG